MPFGVEAGQVRDRLIERSVADFPCHGDGSGAVIAHFDVGLLAIGHVPVAVERAVVKQANRQRLEVSAPPT